MKTSERLLTDQDSSALSDDNEERRARLRLLLDRLRIQEMQRARALRDRDASTPGDEADCAVSEDDIDLSSWLADIAASRRAEVEEALRRAERGGYGLCEDCGDEISAARLSAVPTAVLCVDCQQAREAGSKRLRPESPGLWINRGNSPAMAETPEEDGPRGAFGPRRRGGRRREGSLPDAAAGARRVTRPS